MPEARATATAALPAAGTAPRRRHAGLAAASALLLLLAGAGSAAAAEKLNDPRAPGAPGARAVAASAPNARLAGLIGQGGTILRGKGIAAVTNPGTGQYCIRPSGTYNVNAIVPILGVDFSNSNGAGGLVAQYRSAAFGCPARTIAVLTFANNAGAFALSNNVAFTIVVP